MTTEQTFVIVGAGLAGAKAAESLRDEGFEGGITLIGAETELPYERPPLSKGYLLGKEEKAKLYVHDEGWYAGNAVEPLLGRRATDLDRAAHHVELDDGRRVRYDKLLLVPGASPRRLDVPGADLDGVYHLRDLGDSERLREAVRGGGRRVVVVGAGWIGLETAAAAREYGCEVTVVEPRAVPLHAALGPELGAFFADVHRRHGVDVRLGREVTGLLGPGHVRAVATHDGEEIPADLVIVGIGVSPNTELAERAGLAVDNGILVDESSAPTTPTSTPPVTWPTRSTPCTAPASASSTGPTPSTGERPRPRPCSAGRWSTTGRHTSLPTSTTSAWSSPAGSRPASTTPWSSGGPGIGGLPCLLARRRACRGGYARQPVGRGHLRDAGADPRRRDRRPRPARRPLRTAGRPREELTGSRPLAPSPST